LFNPSNIIETLTGKQAGNEMRWRLSPALNMQKKHEVSYNNAT